MCCPRSDVWIFPRVWVHFLADWFRHSAPALSARASRVVQVGTRNAFMPQPFQELILWQRPGKRLDLNARLIFPPFSSAGHSLSFPFRSEYRMHMRCVLLAPFSSPGQQPRRRSSARGRFFQMTTDTDFLLKRSCDNCAGRRTGIVGALGKQRVNDLETPAKSFCVWRRKHFKRIKLLWLQKVKLELSTWTLRILQPR